MKTLAIDFETANGLRVSACSIGLAWIEAETIVRKEHRLIRPRELRFNKYNIFLHKIQRDHVLNEPDFPTVLSEFLGDLTGALVLAHQADFEVSVIRETLQQYHRQCPEFTFLCTRMISEAVWPQCEGFSLEAVTDYLDIPFRHHNAEEDAVACAKVALAAAQAVGATSLIELAKMISLNVGHANGEIVVPCSFMDGRIPTNGPQRNQTRDAKGPPDNSLHFDIEGSTGNRYEILAWRAGNHFYMTCTCDAGRHGRFCKHRSALLNGVIDHLKSNNTTDVEKLVGLINGSRAQQLFLTVQKLEEMPFVCDDLREAKRDLGFELGRPNHGKRTDLRTKMR